MTSLLLISAAECFQKAMGKQSQIVKEIMAEVNKPILKNQKSKQKDPVSQRNEIKRSRATFINFKKQLEGNLFGELNIHNSLSMETVEKNSFSSGDDDERQFPNLELRDVDAQKLDSFKRSKKRNQSQREILNVRR